MCTDFTDLNRCCPKDDLPLARINQIIDSAVGCDIMALLDCFSGYHQIWLRKEDKEKTSFITSFGTYCYMLEGLCNVGLMFYRMMKVALKDQVDRNVLCYINDIIVASKKKELYISDLSETFTNMCETNLKLNSEMCVFGVTRGKILGCLVSTKGIEASPDKIRAIIQMQPPQTRKEVQKLIGRIAALNSRIITITGSLQLKRSPCQHVNNAKIVILNNYNHLQFQCGLPQVCEEPQAGHEVSTTFAQFVPLTYAHPLEHLPRPQHHRKQPGREVGPILDTLHRLT
jgi:hypothetical protein